MVNYMRDSNSEPNPSVEVGFATDVTRGSSFSPRASGTRVIYAFADDEHKSRSYLTHMNLLFLQTSFP